MALLNDNGRDHPIARDVLDRLREALDRCDRSLRWIAEGDNKTAITQVVEHEGLLIREMATQLVTVAYQLDELATRVHGLDSQIETIRPLPGATEQ
jgi:hypothetical protein